MMPDARAISTASWAFATYTRMASPTRARNDSSPSANVSRSAIRPSTRASPCHEPLAPPWPRAAARAATMSARPRSPWQLGEQLHLRPTSQLTTTVCNARTEQAGQRERQALRARPDAIGNHAEHARIALARKMARAPAPTPSKRRCKSSSARKRLRLIDSSFLAASTVRSLSSWRPRSPSSSRSSSLRSLFGAELLALGELLHALHERQFARAVLAQLDGQPLALARDVIAPCAAVLDALSDAVDARFSASGERGELARLTTERVHFFAGLRFFGSCTLCSALRSPGERYVGFTRERFVARQVFGHAR